jgi:hypothetical protein
MATLGDDFANQAALRTEVRFRLGHPNSTALLPDGQVDSLIRDALRALNVARPLVSVGTFLTVSGTQRYEPLPADGYAIREAWWPAINSNCDNIFSNLVLDLTRFLTQAGPVNEDVVGLLISVEPAAVQRVQREQAWLRRQLGGTARIFDHGQAIYLIPEPTDSGTTVVFTWSGPRFATWQLVHERYISAFWSALEWKGHTRLSTGAGAVTRVRDPEAGVEIVIDTRSHQAAARQAKRSFGRAFPAPTRGFPPT